MEKKKSFRRTLIKILIVVSILIIPIMAISYKPPPDFDYSTVRALETKDGVTKVNFDFLGGFDYERSEVVPDKVNELNGKTVEIVGFMLPIDFDMEGVVKSFMLMATQAGCCFGVMPRMNDFIYVEMPEDKTAEFLTDIPIKVTGDLEIGEDNLVGGLYTMEGRSVAIFKD